MTASDARITLPEIITTERDVPFSTGSQTPAEYLRTNLPAATRRS